MGVRSGAGNAKVEGPFQLRAAAHPLQVVESLTHRPADFGLGYLLDYGQGGPRRVVHGAYGEGSWIFFDDNLTSFVFGRLSARGQGRLLVDGNGTIGGGGALQLTGEFAGWIRAQCSGGGNGAGCFFGEGAVGMYLEAAYGNLYAHPIWSGGVGFIFRTPAMAVVVPLRR
jgi:hypothetical protein